MKLTSVIVLAIVAALSIASGNAFAIAPFKKTFDAKYVKESGDEEFQAAFKKAGCFTCHVKGKKKDVLNAFGWELSTLIEGNAKDRILAARKKGSDAKKAEENVVVKELEAALKKVEGMKALSGKTYGELFKAHELPTADGAKSVRQ